MKIDKKWFYNCLLDNGVPLEQWDADVDEGIDLLMNKISTGGAMMETDSAKKRVVIKTRKVGVDICHDGMRLLPRELLDVTGRLYPFVPSNFGHSFESLVGGGERAADRVKKVLKVMKMDPVGTLEPVPRSVSVTRQDPFGRYPGIVFVQVVQAFDWEMPTIEYHPWGHHIMTGQGKLHYEWTMRSRLLLA